jgi:hypothetical protein
MLDAIHILTSDRQAATERYGAQTPIPAPGGAGGFLDSDTYDDDLPPGTSQWPRQAAFGESPYAGHRRHAHWALDFNTGDDFYLGTPSCCTG